MQRRQVAFGGSAAGVVPKQDCHDCSAFFCGRGVDEEVPDSGGLSLGEPGGRRVEPALEFFFSVLVESIWITLGIAFGALAAFPRLRAAVWASHQESMNVGLLVAVEWRAVRGHLVLLGARQLVIESVSRRSFLAAHESVRRCCLLQRLILPGASLYVPGYTGLQNRRSARKPDRRQSGRGRRR
jgi:hypothetical protein